MSGHRDDGTSAENKAHHPNRKVSRNIWQVKKMDQEESNINGGMGWLVHPTENYEDYPGDPFSDPHEAQKHADEQNEYEEVRKMSRNSANLNRG